MILDIQGVEAKLPGMKPRYVAIIICLLFLLLPTANSSVDAVGYAGDIKWESNLFSPHHLLYNAFGWLLYNLFGGDVLSLMKALNAILAGASVLVLGEILKKRNLPTSQVINFMLLAGGSFGLMRFATDNETYLMPILFSLLASWSFLRYREQTLWLLLSGILAALAVLFHQLHVWWWLGLLVGIIRLKSWKAIFSYALPALMIPLAYLWVLWGKMGEMPGVGEVFAFALHDFAREEVSVGLGSEKPVTHACEYVQNILSASWLGVFVFKKHALAMVFCCGFCFCFWKKLAPKMAHSFLQKNSRRFCTNPPANPHSAPSVCHDFAWKCRVYGHDPLFTAAGFRGVF